MDTFPVHTTASAPDAAVPLLEGAQQAFGFIPNLIGVMASSPALTEAYLVLSGLFDKTSLTATEKQIVLLTVSRYNECHYCMAAHTAISAMQSVPDDVVNAIRDDQPIADARLEALRQFVRTLVDKRGALAETDLSRFLEAGFKQSDILDVLVGMAQKTLSNFTNHIVHTPLDTVFTEQQWEPPGERPHV